MSLINLTRQTEIASTITIADNPWKRMKGLLGTRSLPEKAVLVIPSCQSVHMVFMAYPIDVIFVDRNNRVVGLCPELKPFGFSPIFWKSACALELPTATIARSNTKIGDQLSW